MYEVRSKNGRRLGGPYKTRDEAVQRIRQIKHFEGMGGRAMKESFAIFASHILESTGNIAPIHKGILKIPSDKQFWEMPMKHYINLGRKIGKVKVMRALNNLVRWNKNKHPGISAKAKHMVKKLEASGTWQDIPAKSTK